MNAIIKNMKKAVLTFVIFILQITQIPAQDKVRFMPVTCLHPTENTVVQAEDELTDIPWFVYSDRDDNIVYEKSDGQQVAAKVNFLDHLAVLDFKNDRLLVAKAGNIKNGRLAAGEIEFGWVDLSNLL